MTDQQFGKGFTLLVLSGLTGRPFTGGDEKLDDAQYTLYYSNVKEFPPKAWEAVVNHWIAKETRWPLVSELRALLKARTEVEAIEQERQNRPRLENRMDVNGEPYRTVLRTWANQVGNNQRKTFRQVTILVLEQWCAEHPEDLGAKARMKEAKEQEAAQHQQEGEAAC